MADKLFDNTRTPVRTENTGSNDNDNQEIDYIAAISKDGKAPDVKDLAKGKYHADQHIRNLEQELEGLRRDLDQRLSYEDLMDQIKAMQGQSKPGTPPVETPKADEKPNFSPDDISKLIRDTLNQETTRRTAEQNIASVKKTLEQQWGRDFQRKLLDKANELGVTPDFLEQTAANSPQALYRLVGANTESKPNNTPSYSPPASSVDGNRLQNNRPTGKTLKDYEELRKSDPRTYWSPKVQSEIHKLAREAGESFFK